MTDEQRRIVEALRQTLQSQPDELAYVWIPRSDAVDYGDALDALLAAAPPREPKWDDEPDELLRELRRARLYDSSGEMEDLPERAAAVIADLRQQLAGERIAPDPQRIREWLATDEGKRAFAEAVAQAEEACDALEQSRCVPLHLMDVPLGERIAPSAEPLTYDRWVPLSEWRQLVGRAEQAEAERDAALADARRYRLIRDSGEFVVYVIDDGDDGTGIKEVEVPGEALDATVDACPTAIAAAGVPYPDPTEGR